MSRNIFNKSGMRSIGRWALPLLAMAAAGVAQADGLSEFARQQDAKWRQEYAQAQFFSQVMGIPMVQDLPNGQTVYFVGVENGLPKFLAPHNRVTGITISANKVHPGGSTGFNLIGTGIQVGVWDDGIVNHPELAGRVTAGEGGGAAGHGTGVSGTLAAAGINTEARGVAYGARILSYNFNNSLAELATEAGRGLRISNHSYGLIAFGWGFGLLGDGKWVWFGDPALNENEDYQLGRYDDNARALDTLAYNAPNHLSVWSAGNNRGEGPAPGEEHWVWDGTTWVNSTTTREVVGGPDGYDSLAFHTMAKNALTSGAVFKNANGYTGPSSVRMSSFSQFGPTDDGRVKPDMVAPGVGLFTPWGTSGYSNGTDGTSFSAPAMSGGLALMLEQYIKLKGTPPTAATLKAIAIHGTDEAGANPGPDGAFGWGQMNVEKSCSIINQSAFSPDLIQQRRLTQGQTVDIPVRIGEGPVRITMVWTDPPGPVHPKAANDRTPVLVNDLDMELIRLSDNQTFLPWKLDAANPGAAATRGDNNVDNVEVIDVENAPAGAYVLRISHDGTALSPGGFQDYSLVIGAAIGGGMESVTVADNSLTGGYENTTGTVTLSEAKDEPVVIEISSTNPNVLTTTPSIIIPAGQLQGSFDVFTRAVTSNTIVTIFAGSADLGAVSTNVTVTPITLTGRLELWPGRPVGGNLAYGLVRISAPAPAGGASVYLYGSNESLAYPERSWIVIPEGQTQMQFRIKTRPVNETTTVFINASRGGVTLTNDLILQRAGLEALSAVNTTVTGGTIVRGRILLNGPAGSNGAVVQLSSSDLSAARVPASVRVPAGLRAAEFDITTFPTSTQKTVNITGSRLGVNKTLTLTLRP